MDNNLSVMVRFAELSTKGKNIKDFIKKLGNNLKEALKDYKELTYNIRHDHIYIHLNGVPFENVRFAIEHTPGLLSYSLVESLPKDIEVIKKRAKELAFESDAKTFKVVSKRIDKLFPYHSDEINRIVAKEILIDPSNTKKVDVHNPELKINIVIREDVAYIYSKVYEGLGGYPVGIAGKALMLISGGIDSPVASFLMMRRGVKLEMIHFAAPPYTSDQVLVKIEDLIHKLNVYQPEVKLYIVPFTKIQEKIYEVAGTSYAITIRRRIMLQIAARVAHAHKDIVLASGESIGQVASQTLHSIKAIEEVLKMPLIRPLATYDKLDIIKIAKKIDTYDISIRPYEDCCTIFKVVNPTTKPHKEVIEEIEAKFDFQPLIREAIDNIETRIISKEEDIF